jgi:hypothetical protein
MEGSLASNLDHFNLECFKTIGIDVWKNTNSLGSYDKVPIFS